MQSPETPSPNEPANPWRLGFWSLIATQTQGKLELRKARELALEMKRRAISQ